VRSDRSHYSLLKSFDCLLPIETRRISQTHLSVTGQRRSNRSHYALLRSLRLPPSNGDAPNIPKPFSTRSHHTLLRSFRLPPSNEDAPKLSTKLEIIPEALKARDDHGACIDGIDRWGPSPSKPATQGISCGAPREKGEKPKYSRKGLASSSKQ